MFCRVFFSHVRWLKLAGFLSTIIAAENWLKDDGFLLGLRLLRCELFISDSVISYWSLIPQGCQQDLIGFL